MPSTAMLGFLDLPAEVRIDIYKCLFQASLLSIEPRYQHCRKAVCPCAFPWQLVNTCQQLRAEALPYLLAATTLSIAGGVGTISSLPQTWLPSIPRAVVLSIEQFGKDPLDFATFRALQILELRELAVWCNYHDDESFSGEDGAETMINMAMFQLKRNSLHLHTLCNEKGRSFNILLFCRFVITSAKHETIVREMPDNRIMLTSCRLL
jgi:hypothetical protein